MSFLLAHLSDSHIGPLPRPVFRDLLGKRLTGYINWQRGRYHMHDMDVLGHIVDDMLAHKPDHVAMTGDIMNIGLPAEFPLARKWLETLGSPNDVSFVPGNHDAYVRSSVPMLAQTFGPWTASDGEHETRFPYLRVRGHVALIGVSSGVPTLPLLASGKLGTRQLHALGALLDSTHANGLMRVVMIHHPPTRNGATPGRGLSDSRAFEKIIAAHGAELVLHGHNHRQSVAYIQGTHGRTPVVGVPSASAVPGTERHRAGYHLIRIERVEGHFATTIHARGLLPGTREIGDLGQVKI